MNIWKGDQEGSCEAKTQGGALWDAPQLGNGVRGLLRAGPQDRQLSAQWAQYMQRPGGGLIRAQGTCGGYLGAHGLLHCTWLGCVGFSQEEPHWMAVSIMAGRGTQDTAQGACHPLGGHLGGRAWLGVSGIPRYGRHPQASTLPTTPPLQAGAGDSPQVGLSHLQAPGQDTEHDPGWRLPSGVRWMSGTHGPERSLS